MEMLRLKLGSLLLGGLVIGAVSCKDDDDKDNNNNGIGDDGRNEVVISQIAQSNIAQIEFGELVSTKGADSSVIAFGEMMIDGYENAQEELDSLAEVRDVDLPDSLAMEHDSLISWLSGLSGYQFDTAYINSQIWFHTRTKDLFEAIRDTTDDHGLKTYINKHLPDVNMHLMQADSISDMLMGSDTTNYNM